MAVLCEQKLHAYCMRCDRWAVINLRRCCAVGRARDDSRCECVAVGAVMLGNYRCASCHWLQEVAQVQEVSPASLSSAGDAPGGCTRASGGQPCRRSVQSECT